MIPLSSLIRFSILLVVSLCFCRVDRTGAAKSNVANTEELSHGKSAANHQVSTCLHEGTGEKGETEALGVSNSPEESEEADAESNVEDSATVKNPRHKGTDYFQRNPGAKEAYMKALNEKTGAFGMSNTLSDAADPESKFRDPATVVKNFSRKMKRINTDRNRGPRKGINYFERNPDAKESYMKAVKNRDFKTSKTGFKKGAQKGKKQSLSKGGKKSNGKKGRKQLRKPGEWREKRKAYHSEKERQRNIFERTKEDHNVEEGGMQPEDGLQLGPPLSESLEPSSSPAPSATILPSESDTTNSSSNRMDDTVEIESTIDVTPFAIEYTITSREFPQRLHYEELSGATQDYLHKFYSAYLGSDFSGFKITTYDWERSNPLVVGYKGVVEFQPMLTTSRQPTPEQLDSGVLVAFNGNNYVHHLKGTLERSNPFSTTISFVLEEYEIENTVEQETQPDSEGDQEQDENPKQELDPKEEKQPPPTREDGQPPNRVPDHQGPVQDTSASAGSSNDGSSDTVLTYSLVGAAVGIVVSSTFVIGYIFYSRRKAQRETITVLEPLVEDRDSDDGGPATGGNTDGDSDALIESSHVNYYDESIVGISRVDRLH